MSRQRYYFSIADFAEARGRDPDFAFRGESPEALADALRQALRTSDLFERWRARQEDPDQVDKSLAAVDPQAEVTAAQASLKVDMQVTTDLPMRVLRHRLELLIGSHWTLHDVR